MVIIEWFFLAIVLFLTIIIRTIQMLKHRDTISVSYFAQFLLEIGNIISNIRKYVH